MTFGFGAREVPEREGCEALFLRNLGWIERVAASLCSRYRLSSDDADDFASWVKLKLIENDYAVLRKFRGESAITTYLTVVVASLFRDYRVERWGRWRPSAAAHRLGPVAIRLECLVHRMGHTLDQAAQELRTKGETTLSDREIARLFAKLPPRSPLRPIDADIGSIDTVPGSSSADDLITIAEVDQRRRRAHEELYRALAGLPAEDRVIIRLRIWEDRSVADIARDLGLEQKPLYRRLQRILSGMRSQLEAAGFSRDQIGPLLEESER